MRAFLILAAVLAFLFGAALVFAPGPFLAPMGITASGAVAITAQAQGAILLGLGVINLLARNLKGPAVQPVLIGNFVVQVVSLVVVARALILGIVPPANAPAVVVHTGLGIGFCVFLIRNGRA